MIRAILAGALALALTACNAAERDWPPASPALWHVSGTDGEQGWLLGTVHALPDGVDWRTREIDDALSRSDLLVVEIADLGNRDAAARAFAARSQASDLPPLLERVPRNHRAILAAFLDRANARESAFADVETWAAALMLANAARAHDPANGVDRALLGGGLPVAGLETADAQFAIFDSLTEADQRDLLVALASESATQDSGDLVEAWLTGDLQRLERASEAGLLAYPRLRHVLLDTRNRRWAERIHGLLQEGRHAFVAVGAAHMLGEDGLPELLAARGYTVRRVE